MDSTHHKSVETSMKRHGLPPMEMVRADVSTLALLSRETLIPDLRVSNTQDTHDPWFS
jgi:hypothetical protein